VGKNSNDFTVDARIPLYNTSIEASLFRYVMTDLPFLNNPGDEILFN
jgi:hypothetical protein